MPFRPSFDCLWCGTHHDARDDSDLAGWASLCPDCLGHADDNGFLRARLRAALRERSAAAASTTQARAYDDWYLRRARFSAGPVIDQPWQMELDEATRWLDAIPMSGVIVELAAGSGWWSTLLAGKGELWMFDADEAALELARRRLVAHGLLAHLHVRSPLAAPDRAADVVFSAYLLGAAHDQAALLQRLALVRAWLRPGGTFAFLEAAPSVPPGSRVDGPSGPLRPHTPEVLRQALAASGLEAQQLSQTHGAFLVGSAIAGT